MITLDILGSLFSLLTTFFLVRANPYAWPLGMVATLCNSTLFALSGIYGDMALEFFYFLLTIYGWVMWRQNKPSSQPRAISHLNWQHACHLLMIAVITIPLFASYLKSYLHSDIAYLDATSTILSLLAQWLMCRKVIETWVLWFFIDGLNIWLYTMKGLPFHATLMVIYFGMAISGYWYWQRQLNRRTSPLIEQLNNP